MIEKDIVLAFDTSNYTTSVAILNLDGELLGNLKRPLSVKEGARGLRQSDAVFLHTVNIPELMRDAASIIADRRIVAVGVSERPRNQDGSYMPCFLAGVSAAQSVASALGVPLYRFSHQCGHIMAAVYSSGAFDVLGGEFMAFHISGGTTELVRVTPKKDAFSAEIVGGTKDLNAGQVIDRIGVKMGLPFPAGPHIERLALENTKKIPRRKVSRQGMWLNLSGLENLALKLYEETGDEKLVCAFVLDYLGRALCEISDEMIKEYGNRKLICAGGVMCNSVIKNMISEQFDAHFAIPAMSADNAVGIAVLTKRAHLESF